MSFDTLAPHYRWMELVLAGSKLQRCRTAFLDRVGDAQGVLILGEGNGRFLAECRRRLPSARITCVDTSARMLALAQARIARVGLTAQRTDFIVADARAWVPSARAFDLIVTHFFLDCFPSDQLEQLVAKLAHAAMPRASWLLADFQIPRAGFFRHRAQIIHLLMYAFFRAIAQLPARRLTPPDDFLRAHDFELRQRKVSEWGLLHSDRWTRED
jgi:ubiquinone/menaquinone biosynthesis C-methylase UbiE